MTTKFFANIEINEEKDLEKMVNHYKTLALNVEGEKAEAIAEMQELIEHYNDMLMYQAIAPFTKSENLITDLIPTITLTDREKASNTTRKNKVFNAISYDKYFMVQDDDGTYKIKKRSVPVTLKAITSVLTDSIAFGHADKKVTKQDRLKARNTILPSTVQHVLKLFTYSAYAYGNITEKLKGFYCNATEEEKKMFIDGTPSKARSEKQLNEVAKMLKLDIKFKKVHALTLYHRCYTIDKKGQPIVSDLLDILQDFIIQARYAKNEIELPEVQDKAGIFQPPTKSKEDSILSFA